MFTDWHRGQRIDNESYRDVFQILYHRSIGSATSFDRTTNGVVERFNRTLKEQVIYGRVFKNIDVVRHAVLEFRDNYNRYWRFEKLGFMSPLGARQRYENEHIRPLAA